MYSPFPYHCFVLMVQSWNVCIDRSGYEVIVDRRGPKGGEGLTGRTYHAGTTESSEETTVYFMHHNCAII